MCKEKKEYIEGYSGCIFRLIHSRNNILAFFLLNIQKKISKHLLYF